MTQYRGCNFTGGDLLYTKLTAVGPVSGTHYQLVSTADVDSMIAKGANMFRLVFGWEAMQPTPMGPLGGSTANYNTYYTKVVALAKYITSKGVVCVLDIHGGDESTYHTFAAYYGKKVGTTYNNFQVSDLLVDFWTKLAAVFKDDPNIHFGITNEPTNLPTMTWFTCLQRVVLAIRAAGAINNWIWAPGAYYDGASAWNYTGSIYDTGSVKRSNSYGWDNANGVGIPLRDPANRLGVQVHMYFDPNYSGNTTDIPNDQAGPDRLRDIAAWARARNLRVLIGETGLSASSPIAQAAWTNTVNFINANTDVFAGWLWWAYGAPAWWGNYQFALGPHPDGTPAAVMPIVGPTLAAPPDPTVALQAALDKANQDLFDTKFVLNATNNALTATKDLLAAAIDDKDAADARFARLVDRIKAALAAEGV